VQSLDGFHDDSEGTVFRDVTMLALAGFVAVVVLLLPHITRPGEEAAPGAPPPGRLVVEARWPDAMDVDVDLWVQAPGERPVGYSNRGGGIFDLLRDDLGHRGDPTALNYEVAYARGLTAGEYAVNLHLYRNTARAAAVPVVVVVSQRLPETGRIRQLVSRDVVLRREGEEATVARFRLDGSGNLVPGSLHRLPKALRSAGPVS
jgi:hypothetical protein